MTLTLPVWIIICLVVLGFVVYEALGFVFLVLLANSKRNFDEAWWMKKTEWLESVIGCCVKSNVFATRVATTILISFWIIWIWSVVVDLIKDMIEGTKSSY